MLAKLTPEQKALLPAIREKWLAIGLDTTPVSRKRVEEILNRLYAVANRPPPRFKIFLDSPLRCAIAVAQLRGVAQVSDQVSDQVSAQVRAQVSAQVRDQVRDQVSAQVRAQVRDQVSDQVSDQVRDQVSAQVSDQVRDQVSDQVSDQVRAQVSAQVRAQVSAQVSAQVRAILDWRWWYDFGQFDAGWLSWLDAFGACGVDTSNLVPSFDMAKEAGWSMLFWEWAFVSDKPQCIHRDDAGRLHCPTGPAIRYPDGFSVYAVHGVRVPGFVVESPDTITTDHIDREPNAEVRRVMIERYGQDHYLMDSKAEEIHRDDFGILYRKDIPGDEPLVMVKVVNSTPEPDGSFKDYFLRVPPHMERARQAVAWTFDKEEHDYAPCLET